MNFLSLTRKVDSFETLKALIITLKLFTDSFGKNKPSVFCLSDAWMSKVNELKMYHLKNYLTPIFHPGFKRNDDVVVYVHKSIQCDMLCTKANLCFKIIETTNKNNQCFVVACLLISPSFKPSFILKEPEWILKNFQFNELPGFYCRRYE